MSTLTVKPQASSDDGYVYGSTFSSNGTDLLFGDVGDNVGSFIRFPSVTIPQGATINSAYITYTSKYTLSGTPVNTEICINDVDDAIAPTNVSGYNALALWGIGGNPIAVSWSALSSPPIGSWTAESEYTTPDIKELIQGVIDRAGWTSGNAMLIKHADDGSSASNAYRGAYSYDGSTTKCPVLVIDYTATTVSPVVGQTYAMPAFRRS